MIIRVWYGWTLVCDADSYHELLDREIVPGIIARDVPGLRRVDILRSLDATGEEVGFATVMEFDDWHAVEAFAGPRATGSVVPPKARQLLSRFDDHSAHYQLVASHVSRSTQAGS